MTESGDTVMVKKSVTLLPGVGNLHNLKKKLTERELNCMEVAHCKSHQPTLLCVVNSMQSVKRHFCESQCDNVVTNFFFDLDRNLETHELWKKSKERLRICGA